MVSPLMSTPIAIMAENGIVRGAFEELGDFSGEEAVGSDEARSAKEAEDSRSVTAEMGPVGLFEDPICEDVYILRGKISRQCKLNIGKVTINLCTANGSS